MKKHLLLLIFSFALVRAEAQDSLSRWSIGFAAGPSYPTGRFASKNYNSVNSGYANNGFSWEANVKYAVNRSWALAVAVGRQENKYDIFIPVPPSSYVLSSAQHQNWKMTRLLAGGVYTQPLFKRERLFLQVRLLAGALKTDFPGYDYEMVGAGQLPFYENHYPTISMPWAFCYQADAGLQWKLSKGIKGVSVAVNAGYSEAEPKYSTVDPSFMAAGARPMKTRFVPLASFHLRAGVEVRL